MSVIIKGKNPRKPHTVRYWVEYIRLARLN